MADYIAAEYYCDFVTDGTHDSPKQTSDGVKLVTSKNITRGDLNLSSSYYISTADAQNINKRSKVNINDVLISMIGTVGEVCIIDEEPDFVIKNVGLFKNSDSYKAKWLYFYLSSNEAKILIKERLRGTTQQYLPLKELRNFPIRMPKSREHLEDTIEILWKIKEKIHLNTQINQTLEAIAQAIFKSWFIDFDPVRAKADVLAQGGNKEEAELAAMSAISGKSEEELHQLHTTHLEQYRQLQNTAAAFPCAFVDSELGEIPEGWEIRQVNDFAKIIGGRQLDKSKIKERGNIPVFGGAGIMGYTEEHNAEGFVISIGRVGAYCGQFFSHRGKAYINNNASLIKQKDESIGEWLFISLKNVDIEAIKKGAAQPFVSNTDLGNLNLIWGGKIINNYFTFYLNNIYKNFEGKNIESSSLANLRDILFPRLLSGEISL